MKVKRVTVTPIAIKDPPLLNASGIHEPYALRSILEVATDNGVVGLGESYGDAPVLATLQLVSSDLVGLDPFDLNGLRARHNVTANPSKRTPPLSTARTAGRADRPDSNLQNTCSRRAIEPAARSNGVVSRTPEPLASAA